MIRKIPLASNLSLPPDAGTQTFAFLGQRGKGKSYGAKKLAEGLYDIRLPFVVLDPVGHWWGLRLAADGRSPGLAVTIVGGPHGDVPIEATGGAVLAKFVAEAPRPVVFDIADFGENEKRRFVMEFLKTLYKIKIRRPSPLHIFLNISNQRDDVALLFVVL